MRKFICMMLAVILCVLTLAGCGCKHEWKEATCDAPKTCEKCGETEGEALDHDWEEASCAAPETCKLCGETKGEALEHEWEEATTEAPKTCVLCGETEGEPLDIDDRFTTASTKPLYGTWTYEATVTGEMMDMEGLVDYVDVVLTYQFNKDGTGTRTMAFKDKEAFIEDVKRITKEMVMSEFLAMGLTEDAVLDLFQTYYGMDIDTYINTALDTEGLLDVAEGMSESFVYYVDGDTIYTGSSWDSSFDSSAFSLENGVLVIVEDYLDDPDVPMEWTKTAE